jgi:hypothetical protein
MALCEKHNGFNNGAIGLGFRELARMVDCQNHSANSRALCQLIERGLVVMERDHPRGLRLAREYRLTFVPTGETPATNDYLKWEQGDAGTRRKPPGRRNFRVVTASTRGAVSVAAIAAGGEKSRCEGCNEVDAKALLSRPAPVVMGATHIGKPYVGQPDSPRKSSQNGGDTQSAAPDADELRARVQSLLPSAQRGSQGQLAAIAAIRPAALSKFLHSGGSLNDQSRIRLTVAVAKLAGGRLEAIRA